MARDTSDRNLLVGMLAFQNGFVRREQLLSAMSAWLVEKETPLDEILLRQGALEADSRTLLLALVAKHLSMHDDVPERSLALCALVTAIRCVGYCHRQGFAESAFCVDVSDRRKVRIGIKEYWAYPGATGVRLNR